MKSILKSMLAFVAVALLVSSCATQDSGAKMLQVSWFESFAAGDYAGHKDCSAILERCDTGLGTFEDIDGEMILIDGTIYRVAHDGTVMCAPSDSKTPFMNAVKFSADVVVSAENGMTPSTVGAALDKAVAKPQCFLAAKIPCKLSKAKLRSVPPFKKPYPPLKDVIAKQNVFKHSEISGTLIGIRTPDECKGMNVPGWHFHFISDDRKVGGHALDFVIASGTAWVEVCDSITLLLPDSSRPAAASNSAVSTGSAYHGETAGK